MLIVQKHWTKTTMKNNRNYYGSSNNKGVVSRSDADIPTSNVNLGIGICLLIGSYIVHSHLWSSSPAKVGGIVGWILRFLFSLVWLHIVNITLNSFFCGVPSTTNSASITSTSTTTATDVKGYVGFRFAPEDTYKVNSIQGWKQVITEYLVPSWLSYLIIDRLHLTTNRHESQFERDKPIDILDARNRSSTLAYEKTGFTLIQLNENHYEPTRWNKEEEYDRFYQEVVE